jgi:methionyl-tRNA formyltransferase
MKKMSEPIVFFGSGPVAAASLAFLAGHFTIEAVITKPRPAGHRGAVPVLELAEHLNLKTGTAQDKKALDALFTGRPYKSRLGVLVDFGIIVSQKVINYFPLGIVNSHFSLLPRLRGADPISFAILTGEERTGVSLMLLVARMDEGPLLAQAASEMPQGITTPLLTDNLIQLSNHLLQATLPPYSRGDIKPRPQDGSIPATYSHRLTKLDGAIDWEKPAVQIEREIRAFYEWPKSYTRLGNKEVIVTKAYAVTTTPAGAKPGDITVIKEADTIGVTTKEGSLYIERLKPSGKREMSAREFLAGNNL